MADGSIRIDTHIDDGDLNKEINSMGQHLKRLVESTKRVSQSLIDAFGPRQQKNIAQLTQQLERKQDALRREQRLAEQIKREYDAIASGQVVPASLRRMETDLSRTQKEIQKTAEEYAKLEEQYRKLGEKADFEKMASGIVSPETAAELSRIEAEIEPIGIRLEDAREKAQELQAAIENIRLDPTQTLEAQKLADKFQNSQDKIERLTREADLLDERIQEASITTSRFSKVIDGASNAIRTIIDGLKRIVSLVVSAGRGFKNFTSFVVKLNRQILRAGKSTNGLTKTVEKLGDRIKRLAVAALVFNVLRRGFTQLRNYLWSVMQTNQQFINSLASVKGNLLTAFQPIYEAVMPALNALMSALAKVTGYLAAFINLLFGKSVSASQDAAKSLYGQAKALDATGKAAKDAAGKLAAFDEINVLAQDNAEEAAGGGGSDVIAPDFEYDLSLFEDFFNQFESWPEAFYEMGKRIAEAINSFLSDIDWDAIHERAELIAESIASFLNGAIENLDWELVGYSLGQGINTILHFAEKFIDTFNWQALAKGLATGLNSMVDTIDWEKLGRTFYKGLNAITGAIYTFFTDVDWSNVGTSIVTALNTAVEGIDWDMLGRSFAVKWQALVDILYEFVTNFDWAGFGQGIGTAIMGWFDEIDWSKAGQTVSNGIRGVAEALKNAIAAIDWYQLGRNVWDFIVSIDWAGIVYDVFELLGMAIGAIGQFLWGVIEDAVNSIAEYWTQKFEEAGGNIPKGLWNGIKEGLGNIFNWLKENIFDPFINGFKQIFGIHSPSTVLAELGVFLIQGLAQGIQNTIQMVIDIFTNLWDTVKNLTAEAWEKVKEIWNVVSTWFDETVIQPVSTFFSGLWEGITGFASNAWENIKGVWEKVTGWFDENIITPLTDKFKGFINGILGFFESMANGVIGVFESLVNWIVRAINSISFDLPKILGGGHIGFNIPEVSLGRVSIPKLATGAVIPPHSEFLAVLGDQKHGRNIETPEALLDEKIAAHTAPILDAIEMLAEAIANGNDKAVILQVDGNTILTAAVNAQKSRGPSMLKGNGFVLNGR